MEAVAGETTYTIKQIMQASLVCILGVRRARHRCDGVVLLLTVHAQNAELRFAVVNISFKSEPIQGSLS